MRPSYKTALRVKGIKPIPPYHKLRSDVDAAGHKHISSLDEVVKC